MDGKLPIVSTKFATKFATKVAARVAAVLGVVGVGTALAPAQALGQEFRRLPMEEFRDKMAAAWVGQMAGVGWGGPTEFQWNGTIIPEDRMPDWEPGLINQFHQDDLYVEMTFLRTLELYGFDASIRQAGIDFANSGYPLWHANLAARENLRNGIAPPDSSHPRFNRHADDIDYQIEADFSGIIAPGLPNTAIALGETFGRLMNYGDGMYGGQFVGGMYAEAYFEDDPLKLVEAGLRCIPAESQYAEAIRDTVRWFHENPDRWETTWGLINEKYHLNPEYRAFSCSGPGDAFNIDAKLNGAYIVMGLLYGDRDPDRTIRIATRCGQDSDCNPSNAAGILFTTFGMHNLPDRFTSALDRESVFSHTKYNFSRLLDVCEKLARDAVLRAGGRIERDADGREVMVIPVRTPEPSAFESCQAPGPHADSRYTDEEMERIDAASTLQGWQRQLDRVFPGWTLLQCGPDMEPGARPEYEGRSNVFMTHPLNAETPCILRREVTIPPDGQTVLKLAVARDTRGDFTLLVKAAGETLVHTRIGPHPTAPIWHALEVDLSPFAGSTIPVELVNQPDGWSYEAAYWHSIELVASP